MNIGDRVVVKTDVIREIKNPTVRGLVAGSGVITRNFNSGYFMVKFTDEMYAGGEHGFYGEDLIVVKKADCDCKPCRMKDVGLDEQQEQYVAPDGSM